MNRRRVLIASFVVSCSLSVFAQHPQGHPQGPPHDLAACGIARGEDGGVIAALYPAHSRERGRGSFSARGHGSRRPLTLARQWAPHHEV